MRTILFFDRVFPARDAAAAALARLKADCLLEAGVIDVDDRADVYARTAVLLDGTVLGEPLKASAMRGDRPATPAASA